MDITDWSSGRTRLDDAPPDNVAAIWLPFGRKTVRDGARSVQRLEYSLSGWNGRNTRFKGLRIRWSAERRRPLVGIAFRSSVPNVVVDGDVPVGCRGWRGSDGREECRETDRADDMGQHDDLHPVVV